MSVNVLERRHHKAVGRSEYQNAVERLHDMLVQRSRGGGGDEGEYRRLREYVLESVALSLEEVFGA